MTANNEATLSGEERLKSRRNKFYRFCALGFALGAILGFVSGFASDAVSSGTIPAWSLIALAAAGIAGFTWFSWDYFRRIDELDLLDNLWGSLIALYFYVMALPVWQLLADAGVVGEPQHWPIYIATLLVMFAAYGLRKIGLR